MLSFLKLFGGKNSGNRNGVEMNKLSMYCVSSKHELCSLVKNTKQLLTDYVTNAASLIGGFYHKSPSIN